MKEKAYCLDGYQRLSVAVVKQAVTDYEIALKKLKRNRKDIWASQMRNDCERFFEDEISMYTDIDGKAIMNAIKEKVGW